MDTSCCGSGSAYNSSTKQYSSSNCCHQCYQHELRGNQSPCATKGKDNDVHYLVDMEAPNIVNFIEDTLAASTNPKVCGLPPATGGLVLLLFAS